MKHVRTMKLISLLLAAAITVGLFPTTTLALSSKDTSGHWSEPVIELCDGYGIMQGYNGYYRPDDPITRAEFCAMINRAFNFTYTQSAAEFTDVAVGAWYADDIKIASSMGYFNGTGNRTASPEQNITREAAFTILARIYRLGGEGKTKFTDDSQISEWSRSAIAGMSAAGYIKGDGTKINPQQSITRGEAAQVLVNLFGTIVDSDSSALLSDNITIRKAGVTLDNALVAGDIFITDGVGGGDVTLENAVVSGRTLVTGGGAASIHVKNSHLGTIILDGIRKTHLDLSQDTTVSRIFIFASGSVTHGSVSVSYDAATCTMTFGGTLDKITLNEDGTATVSVNDMIYDIIPVGTGSQETTFALAAGTIVRSMVLSGPANIGGTGRIDQMNIHSNGVIIDGSVNVDLKDIFVDKGIVVIIDGKEYTGDGGALRNPADNTSGGGGGRNVPVSGVVLSASALTLAIDENGEDTLPLTATVLPSNAGNKKVTWSSSDEAVATVDASGNVTAVSAGQATITVTTEGGGFTATASIEVLGLVDFVQSVAYLSAYVSYDPFSGDVYIDWSSTAPEPVFDILSGTEPDNLTQLASVNTGFSHTITNPGYTETQYFQVTQDTSEGLLASTVMSLEFDVDGQSMQNLLDDAIILEIETDPFLVDTDGDGLSDGMENRLEDEGYGFDANDPHSHDGSTLDGDVIVEYSLYLDPSPEDFVVWLSLKIPAKLIAHLSMSDISQDNSFFDDQITGYIGAPAVQIEFPPELFTRLSNIELHCEISGDTAVWMCYSGDPKLTYFNSMTQMFENVSTTYDDNGSTITLTATLAHFSYYTVIDTSVAPPLVPDPDFDESTEFTANTTDVMFLLPGGVNANWPSAGSSVIVDGARRFMDLFGDNFNGVAARLNGFAPPAGNYLTKFTGKEGVLNASVARGLNPYTPNENGGMLDVGIAYSVYFDPNFLPYGKGVSDIQNGYLLRHVDGSYKSNATVRAMIVIGSDGDFGTVMSDSLFWSSWNWVDRESGYAAANTGGTKNSPLQNVMETAGLYLYLISYNGGVDDQITMESYNTNDYVKTFYVSTEQELDTALAQIAYELGTLDITTDSNSDGISDYYTKRICGGSLRLGTGAQLRDKDGNLPDFNTFQSSKDYDNDGIPNGKEMEVRYDTNGNPYIHLLYSNPVLKDSNNNQIPDAYDTNPIFAWQATTAIGSVVKNAGFIYLEKGEDYCGNTTGDFLYARIDAYQKDLGYCYSYDESIIGVSSAILCEPIYFFYDGKEWMVEMWKGQYGIETGAEIGIYNRTAGTTKLGERVAANVSRTLERQVRQIFGDSVVSDLFTKVLDPIQAIANATPDTLVSSINAAIAVVRSNAVHVPLTILLGKDRVNMIINALLTARNYINCKIYDCVGPDEYLELSLKLSNVDGDVLFERRDTEHWWLTGFKWGEFTGDLAAIKCEFDIKFKNTDMRDAFLNGQGAADSTDMLTHSSTYAAMKGATIINLADNNNDNDGRYGLRASYGSEYTVGGVGDTTVSFTFREAKTTQPFAAMLNPAVLAYNRILVASYNAMLYVLDIDVIDPNEIENTLLNFALNFDEAMFNRYKSAFGKSVPAPLRDLSFVQLTPEQKAQIKAEMTATMDILFKVIDAVSNMIFTIAKDVVGPPNP